MGISHKDHVPLRGEMNQPGFSLKYLAHPIEKFFEIHSYRLLENKSLPLRAAVMRCSSAAV
jgi:hypothetical protein